MKLLLAYYGDPILRKKCQPVAAITDEIRQLVSDMIETMNIHDGIGLAAPQVNKDLALFITNVPEDEENPDDCQVCVFINPKILSYSEEKAPRGEGCLSIPEIYGTVWRPASIKVEATDLEGKRFTKEFSHLAARAVMHENDHINGVLFIDRVQGKEKIEIEKELRELKKQLAKIRK